MYVLSFPILNKQDHWCNYLFNVYPEEIMCIVLLALLTEVDSELTKLETKQFIVKTQIRSLVSHFVRGFALFCDHMDTL